MFDTCINNVYVFIDDILIYLGIRKEEKHNFYEPLIVKNYTIKPMMD